jgi:hypothetical protein
VKNPLEAIRKIVQEEIRAAEKRSAKRARVEPPAPKPKDQKKPDGFIDWLTGGDDE